MWKWILGGILVILIVLAGTCWYGYTKLTAGGDSATVVIGAAPDRVFTSLTDPDSMALWMEEGSKIVASHHGPVAVGDTLHVESGNVTRNRQQFTWTVTEVETPRLLVLQMRNDSSGKVFAMRRDSLVASNDSTVVITTIASPAMDSMRVARGDTGGKIGGAFLDIASKTMVSIFRTISEHELQRLKARLEGHPMPAN